MEKDLLVEGRAASKGNVEGIAYVVSDEHPIGNFPKDHILVCEMTNPDMTIQMRKSKAIITDRGGLTSHAAVVARENKIPCIAGSKDATEKIPHGALISVEVEEGITTGVGRAFLIHK